MPDYCEDWPCCGHTALDPCSRQWYDDPSKVRRHLFCDHETGYCDDIAAEAGRDYDNDLDDDQATSTFGDELDDNEDEYDDSHLDDMESVYIREEWGE